MDADRAAVDGVLQHLTTVAAALGYALGKRKKLSKMDQLAKAAQDIQKMVCARDVCLVWLRSE